MSKKTAKPAFKKVPSRPAGMRTVETVPVVEQGVFAVMRHSLSRPKNMHFTTWQETEEAAVAEAQRLAASVVAEHGQGDTCFYVLQVVRRVGIINGKLVS